jgi:hypothetical protein
MELTVHCNETKFIVLPVQVIRAREAQRRNNGTVPDYRSGSEHKTNGNDEK